MHRRSVLFTALITALALFYPFFPTQDGASNLKFCFTANGVASGGSKQTSAKVNAGDSISASIAATASGASLSVQITEPGGASSRSTTNSGSFGGSAITSISASRSGTATISLSDSRHGSFSYSVTVCGSETKPAVTNDGSPLRFTDGRCNQEADQPVAVFPDSKGGYVFYSLYQGIGYYAFRITEQQLDNSPAQSVSYLIAHRLSDGSLVVTSIQRNGKLYQFNIGSCGAAED